MGTCQPSAALILCNKIITNYFGKKKKKAHIKMNLKMPHKIWNDPKKDKLST